jgi:hypothetical protein
VSKLSAFKEHFLKHGTLYTSVTSVAIASMAFFLTIYNARLDRQYKELGIKPALHLHVETSDFHVGFVNTGLGPAEIISVATKFEPDMCVILHNRPRRRLTCLASPGRGRRQPVKAASREAGARDATAFMPELEPH